MLGKRVKAFCIVAACLATISCQRLQDRELNATGPLAYEPIRFADAIPDDYGPLIGVTQNAVNPEWVSLWFQKQDKTIITVSVNVVERRISGRVLTIPRK